MADPSEIERIRAYLEQHRNTYDGDALGNNLLADGHDPEAIEQAMAQVYAEQQGPPASQAASMTAVTLLAGVGTVLLNGGLCLAGYRFIPSSGFVSNVLGALVSILAIAYFTHRQPAVARGVRWGCAIWALIVVGITVFVFWSLSRGP